MRRIRKKSIEPLRCPFCDSAPKVTGFIGGGPKRAILCVSEDCGVRPMVMDATIDEALGRWNRRALHGGKYAEAWGRIIAAARECEGLRRERDEARRFGEDAAAKYNALIAEGPTLTCAFCGEAYPPGTPATQHELLTAHVVNDCKAHPMRKMEEKLAASERERERLNLGLLALLEMLTVTRQDLVPWGKVLRTFKQLLEPASITGEHGEG